MDFDAFKKLPEGEALAAAGKIAGVDASVFDGIWRTESSRGRAMLSPAGARGHFGLMPDTQASLEKRFARKINPDNFHDSLFASAELMRENLARFGSLPDALRAYNGGWKPEKWDNPETRAYVGKVLGTDSTPQNPEVIAAYAKGEKKVKRPLTSDPLFADMRFVDQDKALNELADGIIKEAQQASETSLLDSARAAFMNQGLASIPLAAMVKPTFEPTPGFTMTPQKAAGLTEDEIAQLATARSEAEEDYELQRIMWARDDMAEVGRGGMLQAIGASLVAGLPESILLGRVMAVPRLVANSVRSAEQVKRANYVRSAVENIGGNIAATALEDALTNRVSAADYPIGAAMGLIGVAADIPATRRGVKASAMQAERELAERALVEAGERKAEYNRKAIEALGPDATQEQVVAEAIRLETADAQRLLASAAAPRIENPLMPDLGKLEAEEAEVLQGVQASRSADTAGGALTSVETNPAGLDLPVLPASSLDRKTLTALPKGAADTDQWGVIGGWLEAESGGRVKIAEVQNALAGGESLAVVGPQRFSAGQVKAAQWFQKNFLGSHRVALLDYAETGRGGDLGDSVVLDANTSIIRFRSDSDKWATTLAHEFGHIVLKNAISSTDKRVQEALTGLRELHGEWLNRYTREWVTSGRAQDAGLSSAEAAALERGGVSSAYTPQAMGVPDAIDGFLPSLLDVMSGVINRIGKGSLQEPAAGKLHSGKAYIPEFDEFAAEQMSKYIEQAIYGSTGWKPSSIPMDFIRTIKAVWDAFAKFFNKAVDAGYMAPEARAEEFFEAVRRSVKSETTIKKRVAAGLDPYRDAAARVGMDAKGFEAWFKGSVITEEDGVTPKIMYHGRKSDWRVYDMDKETWGIRAIFVSPDPKFAEDYVGVVNPYKPGTGVQAQSVDPNAGPNIIPVYVSLKKPFVFDNPKDLDALLARPSFQEKLNLNGSTSAYFKASLNKDSNWNLLEKDWVQDEIRAMGYDGTLVVENGTRNYAVYNATAIKSIFNKGTFDQKNPDITKSATPEVSASKAPQQEPDISFLDSPIAQKYGLGLLPVATPQQRAEAKALIAVYERADPPTAPWNNIDKERISIMQKSASLGSTGLHLLTSANPVARMFAYEMLESTTGAGGRHVTGSLAKYLSERRIVGTLQPEYEGAYALWRQANGGSIVEDHWGGTVHERFNREVAREIERRNQPAYEGALVNPFVAKAADALERSFERSRIEQVNAKVTGWGGLPNTSRGYMPHSMSPEKLRNATKAQREALHSALVDQFVSIEGWDITFSANLASKYMDRVHQRGTGGYETTANIHSVGAADMIEDALTAMGMSQDEVRAQMQRYMRGAAKHTKARIKLDLSREYTDAETGKTFTLLDLFDTDVVGLARKQARRVSGEVALAQRGIMGRPGLKLMKRAIGFGETGTTKASDVDLTAFDQVAAEFLGDPFGKQQSKFMERAMTTNSLVRLGGMGFTQMSELFNAMFTLGVRNTAAIIPQFARLRAEAAALARGEKVNSILTSIETSPFGGEIGTDAYKMAFPFDSPSQQYQVNGAESITAFDRLIRRGSQVQGMLSGWRAIHAAQQRGVAEQIVLKSLRYIRDGKNDAALADMGITKEVADAMRAEFANTVVWSPDGKVQEFDIGKMENTRAAEAYIQAVHRGTGQLIQQTFIGETGAWAHNDWLKLMTQFRTFSITSMEKQWTRNRANHGVQKALAMVIATIAAGAPIYIARAYASSIGRDDQEEYLERRLSWEAIARGSMNYSAMTGLAPDLVDAIASITGHSTTGGRIGTGTEFFGGTVAPALGLADQAYKAIQNTKDGTDLSEAMRVLPMNGLPFVTQAINAMVN